MPSMAPLGVAKQSVRKGPRIMCVLTHVVLSECVQYTYEYVNYKIETNWIDGVGSKGT